MADEVISRDQNFVTVLAGITDDSSQFIRMLRVDPITGRLLVSAIGVGAGTVTSVSVVTANGFAGSVLNPTSTPAITISTTINAPVLAGNGTAISAATTTGSGSTVVLSSGPSISGATITTSSVNGVTLTTGGSATAFLNGAGAYTTPSTTAALITVANEATNTTCFIAFFTAATGDLQPKTNANLTYNSNTGAVGITGALTATTFNGLTITANGTNTLTIAAGKTVTVNKSLTFDGTDSTTMTFPSTSATIARTDAANTFTGASTTTSWVETTPKIVTSITPNADDGATLGDTTHNFSDLFLATGAVINYQNGNVVITHSSGILTMGTGELRITSANVGTNADSVPTLSSTSTLTNKTLTSPVLTTPSGFTTGGTITLAENTSIALDPAGSADGKYTGVTIAGTCGYAAASGAFGDLVYLAVADSRWEKADADAQSTAGNVMMGMMLTDAVSDGGACNILLIGQIRADAKFPALTVGAAVYAGETAGAIQVAIPTGADNVIRVVGFALTADEIYFNPSQDHQITVA